ncbi:S8 family peptidase [Actinoplanes sp. GCM10030250]|uniref:S8 family peptidase n=1 Tax=Actinoplanes sp. GCM10030250 TaxID=3273376 RepID=UPI00360A20DB
MKVRLRRYAAGAVAAGALAAAGVFVMPSGTAGWEPVTYGLTQSPEQLLPETVTETKPARIVTTTVDRKGRPVVTVKEATNRKAATRLVKEAQKTEDAVSVELDFPVHALGVPTGSDTYRSQQWDFAKLKIAEAWKRSTGAGVTVAVIDTGVDARHPDLAKNVLSGYDALTNKAGVSTDGNGHGTHVAGTIAAVTGNNIGVSAVAPDVKILPVKVLSANGSGNTSDTAEGIIWAADNGAKVINMSLGGSGKAAAVSNAIRYARSKGVTVVAAAGNSRGEGSPINYPGADEGVIAVAATDAADRFATYSNAGSYVDVAAPGSAIMSTYPNSSYMSFNGTSMATPHVAAVAALLKSYSPALTPDQIESALEKTSVDLGASGFDKDYGYGRIDPVAALASVAPRTTPPTTAPTSSAARANPLLTTTVISREVAYGTSTATTFTVRVAGKVWARKPVSLCVSEAEGEFFCTDTTTTVSGTVVLSRPATSSYKANLKVAETETTNAATSPTATYRVRAKVTVTRTSRGVMTVRLTGAAGQTVQVQQYMAGRWVEIGDFPAAATTTVSGMTIGQRYRVVVPDTAAILGVTSAGVMI